MNLFIVIRVKPCSILSIIEQSIVNINKDELIKQVLYVLDMYKTYCLLENLWINVFLFNSNKY